MESDKPDLNSILENARAHLDMYGRSSQDDLTEPTKEILLTRPKDQEMEDVSGPLFDKAKESDSGKSISSQNQNPEDSQEAKVLGINPQDEADIEDVEGEESSNKNFDSSTMTLGDQQSFQNQVELTSQTTYTNIHELTGPVKDDILVVTGPIPEPSDTARAPSHVSQNETEDVSSETTQVTLENVDPEIMATEDELQKPDELQHNQMAGTNIYFRGWKSDPCRDTLQENLDHEELSQLNQRDDDEKGDTALKTGAGAREGSPVRTGANLMLQVAERLCQLELHEGKQCSWLKQGVCEKGIDCVCERNVNDELNKNSSISVSYLDVKDDQESKSENTRSCDVAPTIQSYPFNNIDNRQIEFVQYYEANEVDKSEGNVRKVSDKSIFEDEGFVDSKELMDSAKVIFISDQEDEQSCKPFETEDDTSCLLEPSSAGRSLDIQSDLEAKPSLTDVHQVQKHQITADDIIDSEKALSTEGLNSNEKDGDNCNSEEQLFQINPNQEVENAPSEVPKETMLIQQNNSTAGPEKSLPTHDKHGGKTQMDISENKSQPTSQDQNETAKSITEKTSYNQNESSKAVESDLKQASTSQHLNETITSIPNIVELITKSHDTTKEVSKGKPLCIGRAIFEAFIKNMSKTKSNSPELSKLTAILERASQSTNPSPEIPKPIMLSKSSSGTDFESVNECSTQISSCEPKGCDDISSSGSETETDSEPLNPLDIIEKLANDPMTIPLIPTTLLNQPLHQQVNSDGSSSGIPLILNPETFIDLKLHQSVPVASLNHVPNIDLIDDPQIPHISATDLDSINTFDPLSSSKDVYLNDTEETISSKIPEESRTVRSNNGFNRLPSPPSSDILDSTIENISSDIVTPIIEEVFSSNSEESVPVLNPLISMNSPTDNNESPEISDLIFKSIRVTISEQLKASLEQDNSEPMPHLTTDLNVQTNELEDGKTADISEKSPEVEKNVALSKSNSPSKSDHPLTPFVSEIQSPGSSPGPNIIHYITDPPLPNIKPPSPNRLDFQIFSPEDVQSDAEEEVNSAKAPPRPPPRPRASVQTKKKKLNFFKKLFGIKAKN